MRRNRTRGKERPSSQRLRSDERRIMDRRPSVYDPTVRQDFYENRRTNYQTNHDRPVQRRLRRERRPVQVFTKKTHDVYRPWTSSWIVSPTQQALFTQKQNDKTICERREVRKEIMHATGRAGKGGQAPPKWTRESYVKCRRR